MIESLPRREREVFETLCRLENGSTSAVRGAMGGNLSDSAVRTLLARLELTQKLKPEELEALERAIDEARERGS